MLLDSSGVGVQKNFPRASSRSGAVRWTSCNASLFSHLISRPWSAVTLAGAPVWRQQPGTFIVAIPAARTKELPDPGVVLGHSSLDRIHRSRVQVPDATTNVTEGLIEGLAPERPIGPRGSASCALHPSDGVELNFARVSVFRTQVKKLSRALPRCDASQQGQHAWLCAPKSGMWTNAASAARVKFETKTDQYLPRRTQFVPPPSGT
jgi:hypothetical protein